MDILDFERLRKEQNVTLEFANAPYRQGHRKQLYDGLNALTVEQILNYTPSTAHILQKCFGTSATDGTFLMRNCSKEFSVRKFYTQESVCYTMTSVIMKTYDFQMQGRALIWPKRIFAVASKYVAAGARIRN